MSHYNNKTNYPEIFFLENNVRPLPSTMSPSNNNRHIAVITLTALIGLIKLKNNCFGALYNALLLLSYPTTIIIQNNQSCEIVPTKPTKESINIILIAIINLKEK